MATIDVPPRLARTAEGRRGAATPKALLATAQREALTRCAQGGGLSNAYATVFFRGQ